MNLPLLSRRIALASAACLLAASGSASAGLFDFLGNKATVADSTPATQRVWPLSEVSSVSLVEREAGSAPNLHPVTLDAEVLKLRLTAIRAKVTGRSEEALFDSDELDTLVPALIRALALAQPADDIVLVSTARRGGSFAVPLGVTARLFLQDDGLNLIVNDARLDFVLNYRNTHTLPQFVHGSRGRAGPVKLRSESAVSKRDDWLVVPVNNVVAAPLTATRPATPQVATPQVGAAPAAAVGSSDDIEEQLQRLKRLRAKDLISEDEYQQLRREILQKLR